MSKSNKGENEIVLRVPTSIVEGDKDLPHNTMQVSFSQRLDVSDLANTWLATSILDLRKKITDGNKVLNEVQTLLTKARTAYAEALNGFKSKKLMLRIKAASAAVKPLGYEVVLSSVSREHLEDKGQVKFTPKIEFRRLSDKVEFFEAESPQLRAALDDINSIEADKKSVLDQLDTLSVQLDHARDPQIGKYRALVATVAGTEAESVFARAIEDAKRRVETVPGVEIPACLKKPGVVKEAKSPKEGS